MPTLIPCSSSIVDVTVHGRGAVVTRDIALPDDLPDGPIDVVVSDITSAAQAGSVRAMLAAPGRTLISLQSSLDVPAEESSPGPSVERVAAHETKIERLEAERSMLRVRRERLEALEPKTKGKHLVHSPQEGVQDGIAVSKMVDAILEQIDARLLDLDGQIEDEEKLRDDAILRDAQARSEDRQSTGHPMRRVTFRLDGSGTIDSFRMTYVVSAARWWPVYTLRLARGGKRATWWTEGLVAQLSGEDWKGVRLGLSTANLISDVRLPELPSLRIGRARPTTRRGYRPPPPDLDRMFQSFDQVAMPDGDERSLGQESGASVDESEWVAQNVMAEASAAYEGEKTPLRPAFRGKKKARSAPVPLALGPVMAPPSPSATPQMTSELMVKSTLEVPQVEQAPVGAKQMVGDDDAFDGVAFDWEDGLGTQQDASSTVADAIEPSDAWLDFDSLRVADGMDTLRRGRLVRAGDLASSEEHSAAQKRIESLEPAPGLRDPLESRGSFDHRYDAQGRADVPSDGNTHRVSLGSAEAQARSSYRTLPVISFEVYRELSLTNPFDAPLLDGPVDVYVDGSLLVTTHVERIDRGGEMRIGLGEEERIRVARNVRVEEETTGLLGGTTVVNHRVSITLRSSLGHAVEIEVLDRIPDSDDRNIDIKLSSSSPRASRYTQAERGVPVRGGLRWSVELSAGGDQTITYAYRINLPSKYEIVGGNHRD